MAKPVGKLKKINVNEVWANDVDGFASWLQQEEILEMLGETLELSLEPAGEEVSLQTLSGGVLAKDSKRGHYVIIVGHLDGMSPEALGNLIMYAAGLDAKALVCVGQEITAEMRQSLDWLNMISRDDVNVYAAELELWRIDDSVPAPNFNVVCQPNMWARQLKMGQEDGESADNSSKNSKSKEPQESKSQKEEPVKASKEKVEPPQSKSGASPKEGTSVRQNFVYTKTFS